ncbi:hypothetical protein BS47DRAFT_1487401 [Hydnum rufescens UP504]|uniref:Uncharacterized protein n=1 Tax=Hydnum rufescens UP504 TaxID=1448309 RepID=A0A9P6DQW5_9AGAM|nr:hypothetical protein BS47DRAFT_1487401 [Hydnum rufescens UP504]
MGNSLIALDLSLHLHFFIMGKVFSIALAAACIGGAILSATIAPVAAPVVLGVVGFGAEGVAAAKADALNSTISTGSVAAGIQAGIGNVAAGSLFAGAQSVAAGGALPMIGTVISAGIGAVTGIFFPF